MGCCNSTQGKEVRRTASTIAEKESKSSVESVETLVVKRNDASSFSAVHNPLITMVSPSTSRSFTLGSFNDREPVEFKTIATLNNSVVATTLPFVYESAVMPGLNSGNPNQRKECQDTSLIMESLVDLDGVGVAAVFDGHGANGRRAAQFVKRFIPGYIYNKTMENHTFQESCTQAFEEAELQLMQERFDTSASGTTATVVLLKETEILASWVGDSTAVMCRQVDGRPTGQLLTLDHKPSDAVERERIEKSGGLVASVPDEEVPRVFDKAKYEKGELYPGLAMARSIGDHKATDLGCFSTPDTATCNITPEDEFMIVASDGLWDTFSPEEAVQWVMGYVAENQEEEGRLPGHGEAPKHQLCAKHLALEAQRRWVDRHVDGIADDTTVVIVWFKSLYSRLQAEQVKQEKEEKLEALVKEGSGCVPLPGSRREERKAPQCSQFKSPSQVSFKVVEPGASFKVVQNLEGLLTGSSEPSHRRTSRYTDEPRPARPRGHEPRDSLVSVEDVACSDVDEAPAASEAEGGEGKPGPGLEPAAKPEGIAIGYRSRAASVVEGDLYGFTWQQLVVTARRKGIVAEVDDSFMPHRERVARMQCQA
eukprot:CAMPEP_0118923634 /NCGR_PEP_ID=MMETSP1169-20130426/2082_1 /TAXON_ID=36882 /ORGANISM="Pyramimonas obovata, Strain CCMP722" /LENGTH=594 /DNA_ID=CAMNT_0006864649 /DNA_START=273 /DNA_END=2057 /DNA_ORIENTATION=-